MRSPRAHDGSVWHLYVLECSDRTLYVGIAKDVDARFAAHSAGRGAKYTRTRRPLTILYRERCGDIATAMRRERQVKSWSRPQKIARLALPCAASLSAA